MGYKSMNNAPGCFPGSTDGQISRAIAFPRRLTAADGRVFVITEWSPTVRPGHFHEFKIVACLADDPGADTMTTPMP